MDSHVIEFCGKKILTTVTRSSEVVSQWVSRIFDLHYRTRSNLVLGLDIEWRPYYRAEDRNPVATLQICDGIRCLVFQLLHADRIPGSLRNFLACPGFTFAGVGVEDDAHKLFEELRLRVASTMDLAQFAADKFGFEDYRRWGLKRLAMQLIGMQMEKPMQVTLSKWDEKELSHKQIEYAAIDAYVSCEIGLFLTDEFRRVRPVFPVHHRLPCNFSTVPILPNRLQPSVTYLPPLLVVYTLPPQFV